MRGKADCRLAAFHYPLVALVGFRRIRNDIGCLFAEALHAELVEMGKFNGNATKIVPDAAQNVLDFIVRFLRKSQP
jgi:hypothetical protein